MKILKHDAANTLLCVKLLCYILQVVFSIKHDIESSITENPFLSRSVIPYAHSPSVRKLSKIATLLLAKNYILMQANALEEMKRLIAYLQSANGAVGAVGAAIVAPPGFDLQGFPAAAKFLQQQQSLQENARNRSNDAVGSGLPSM